MPADHSGHLWGVARADVLGAFSVNLNWRALNYSDPETQMKMIQQFESVVASPYIGEIDTRYVFDAMSMIALRIS